MRTPADERDVLISWYTSDDECRIYTSDYIWMNRFDKKCREHPDVWKLHRTEYSESDIVAKTYIVPVKCLSFRNEIPKGREMTEEERRIAGERLRKLRESKN